MESVLIQMVDEIMAPEQNHWGAKLPEEREKDSTVVCGERVMKEKASPRVGLASCGSWRFKKGGFNFED